MEPEGISRVVNRGLARQYRQGFQPWTSTETTNFAVLAVVDPIWIVTMSCGMEISESQEPESLCWTPSGWHMEWRILAHFEQQK